MFKKIGDSRLLTVVILTAVCIILLAQAVSASPPNPGHYASNISGGTFSTNDGDFTFPSGVNLGVGAAPQNLLNVYETNDAETDAVVNISHAGTPIVYITTTASSGDDAELHIRGARTTSTTSDIAEIYFEDASQSAALAKITMRKETGATDEGNLIFWTNNGSGTNYERMRIWKDGGVSIGADNVSYANNPSYPLMLAVGDGTQNFTAFFNASKYGLISYVLSEDSQDSPTAVKGHVWNDTGGNIVAGNLAVHESDVGWAGVSARYYNQTPDEPVAYLATADYAGYFEGNVSSDTDFCIDGGGNCLSTAGAGSVGGSGTAGRIARWDTGGTDLTNTIITESSNCIRIDAAGSTCTGTEALVVDGMIGVDVTAPSAELHVHGAIVGNNTPGVGSGSIPSNTGVFGVGSTYGVYGRWGDAGDYPYGTVGSEEYGVLGRSSATVYGGLGYGTYAGVFMGGNVGIGTLTPTAKLFLRDDANDVFIVVDGQDDGISALNLSETGIGYFYADEAESEVGIFNTLTGGAAGPLIFGTSETEQVRIDKDGNMGIGSTDPDALLDVEASSGGAATIGHADSSAEGSIAVAIGRHANASGTSSVAIGGGSSFSDVLANGTGAIALGYDSTVAGGEGSIAMGMYSEAKNYASIAIGYDADTEADLTMAFGNSVTVTGANSIAFGLDSNSYTHSRANTFGILGGDLNVTGTIFYGENLTGYGSDFAEMLSIAEAAVVKDGDVVCLDTELMISRCDKRADPSVAGVVSGNPTIIGNAKVKDGAAVGIAGIVPTKVKGPIARFDLLTTSTTPGHAETATIEDFGSIIGKAMEPCEAERCTIKVLVGLR